MMQKQKTCHKHIAFPRSAKLYFTETTWLFVSITDKEVDVMDYWAAAAAAAAAAVARRQ